MPVIGYSTGREAHLEGLEALALSFAWLEHPDRVSLCRWARPQPSPSIEQWPEGRLFGADGEYRWRLRNDGLHVVLLLDVAALLPAELAATSCSLQVADAPRDREEVALWGDLSLDNGGTPIAGENGPLFSACEIPSRQSYPVAEPCALDTVACLKLRRYVGEAGEFTRCVEVGKFTSYENAFDA